MKPLNRDARTLVDSARMVEAPSEEYRERMRQRIAAFRRAQFTISNRLAKSYQEHDAIVTAVPRAHAQTPDGPMPAAVREVRRAASPRAPPAERAPARRSSRTAAWVRRPPLGRS